MVTIPFLSPVAEADIGEDPTRPRENYQDRLDADGTIKVVKTGKSKTP